MLLLEEKDAYRNIIRLFDDKMKHFVCPGDIRSYKLERASLY